MTTETVLTRDEAVEVAQALLAAAGLTLSGRSEGLCASCLAAGDAP